MKKLTNADMATNTMPIIKIILNGSVFELSKAQSSIPTSDTFVLYENENLNILFYMQKEKNADTNWIQTEKEKKN